MPDLTLYREDAELIEDTLRTRARFLEKALDTGEVDASATEEIQAIAALRDKLIDRINQRLHPRLHPKREAQG